MHILLPETDNCPSWISRREGMTIESISRSISKKGSHLQPDHIGCACIQLCHRAWRNSNLSVSLTGALVQYRKLSWLGDASRFVSQIPGLVTWPCSCSGQPEMAVINTWFKSLITTQFDCLWWSQDNFMKCIKESLPSRLLQVRQQDLNYSYSLWHGLKMNQNMLHQKQKCTDYIEICP